MFLQCNYSDRGTWKKIIPITKFFWKQWILKFFLQTANKIQGSTMQPMKTLKPVWTYLTPLETALKFMNVIGPFTKKKLGKNLLWLGIILYILRFSRQKSMK